MINLTNTIGASRKKFLIEVAGIVALLALMGWLFSVYNADHHYPPCCDTSITMMKAKVMVQEHSLNALQRFNPSYETKLYGSIISSEIVLHLLMAGAFALHHPWMYDLAFAKHFFLILFLLPALVFYALGRHFFQRPVAGLLLVALIYLSTWYGNAYWTGHVAEFPGFAVLGFIILILDTIHRRDQRQMYVRLAIAWALLGLLFFIHVLAFMVGFMVTVVATLLFLGTTKKNIAWLAGAYGAVALLFAIYLKFLPIATTLVPSFGFNELVFNFPSILAGTVAGTALLVFFLLGILRTLSQRKIIVITWFIASYLLSQSTLLGASFFSYRFNEFIVIPILVMVIFGLMSVLRLFPRPITQIAVILVLLVSYLPYGLQRQNQIKQCYIQNCAGLSPTQVPNEDLIAWRWMEDHLPQDARILAYQKFGYYLPIVTDFSVEFPEIDKAKIYTSYDVKERHAIAKKYGIEYVYWDAVFLQQNDHISEAPGYTISPFRSTTLFKKIYDAHGAKIYQVL